jgi:hypothetical protein
MTDPKQKVSKFFSYGELYLSEGAKRLGIDNRPTDEHLENLIWYANNIGDPCRMFVGGPLHISFYRSEALNNATPGSAKPSFHMLGMAGDMDCQHYGHGHNGILFEWIVKNLTFAQIIWEFGSNVEPDWIHVTAFPESKKIVGGLRWNEKKLTRAIKENDKTKYIAFDL